MTCGPETKTPLCRTLAQQGCENVSALVSWDRQLEVAIIVSTVVSWKPLSLLT